MTDTCIFNRILRVTGTSIIKVYLWWWNSCTSCTTCTTGNRGSGNWCLSNYGITLWNRGWQRKRNDIWQGLGDKLVIELALPVKELVFGQTVLNTPLWNVKTAEHLIWNPGCPFFSLAWCKIVFWWHEIIPPENVLE